MKVASHCKYCVRTSKVAVVHGVQSKEWVCIIPSGDFKCVASIVTSPERQSLEHGICYLTYQTINHLQSRY